MAKALALIFLYLFLSFNVSAKRTYKIALSSSCPYYCTEENHKKGYIVDLLDLFFKKHGIKVKFETTPYARLYDNLKSGVSDLALFTSLDVRNHSNFIIYDVTLGVSSAGIVSRTGTNPVVLDFIDLKDKILFLTPGSKASEIIYNEVGKLNKDSSSIQLITGSRIHDRLIDLVALGRADYAIDDYNVLKYFYSKSAKKNKVVLTPTSISGYNPLKFVSSKSLPIQSIIEKDLNKFVEQYRKSGKLQILLKKYNIIDWNIVLTR
ncbi:transporter substrate-binding domain-containing protein [Halobacteriovorax sp. JY17]|uniref:transporter substrate-binding domain-containing protein n=1 Tax=Halobacteriovorax sp. JY17 TaxID=2014617 RepID=UPI000C54B595|nr:transporter substrate-binding domain-containing protein [Halobacteriovorax sp. JY17]PIK15180.1 MAG: hypothetical protein CES88_00275 [Halobacteriovorax sp. JY17]